MAKKKPTAPSTESHLTAIVLNWHETRDKVLSTQTEIERERAREKFR